MNAVVYFKSPSFCENQATYGAVFRDLECPDTLVMLLLNKKVDDVYFEDCKYVPDFIDYEIDHEFIVYSDGFDPVEVFEKIERGYKIDGWYGATKVVDKTNSWFLG